MIGVTHIWTVTAQGTEEERLAMLRVMGAGVVDDTQDVERLRGALADIRAELKPQPSEEWPTDLAVRALQRSHDAMQDRVAELEAERDAMVAAAYEAAAKFLSNVANNWDCGHMESRLCDCARDAEQWGIAADEVNNITPADAKAALDRLINEAVQAALAAQGAK